MAHYTFDGEKMELFDWYKVVEIRGDNGCVFGKMGICIGFFEQYVLMFYPEMKGRLHDEQTNSVVRTNSKCNWFMKPKHLGLMKNVR